jgi:hypothetical protein
LETPGASVFRVDLPLKMAAADYFVTLLPICKMYDVIF